MIKKKNLVIFSGSNKPSFFLDIQQELILIANNLDTSLYTLSIFILDTFKKIP